MAHNYINLEKFPQLHRKIILHGDFNLEQKDNLAELPTQAAVYAICGRVNGKAVNPRFIGKTHNLQASVKQHFGEHEQDPCLKTFMQSIKIKELLFQLIEDDQDQLGNKWVENWTHEFQPECQEEMNKTY